MPTTGSQRCAETHEGDSASGVTDGKEGISAGEVVQKLKLMGGTAHAVFMTVS